MTQVLWSVQSLQNSSIDLSSCVVSTEKLQITTSPFSLYPYVEWQCKVPEGLLEAGFFNVGNLFKFSFPQSDGKTFVIRTYGILTLTVGTLEDPSTLSTLMSFTLTSPAYFQQTIKSKAYKGIASTILTQLLTEDFPTVEKSISTTFEKQPLSLYRTQQTPFNFIQKRLLSYCTGENRGAYFIYGAGDGSIRGRSLSDMTQEHTNTVVMSESSTRYSEYLKRKDIRIVPAYSIELSTKEDLWSSLDTSFSHILRYNMSVKQDGEAPKIDPFTRSNVTRNAFALVNPEREDYTKAVLDDSLNTYSNLYSETTQSQIRTLLQAQTLRVVGNIDLDLEVGDSSIIVLDKQTENKLSIFSGTYPIISLTKMFQGTTGWMTIDYGVPGFTFSQEKDVLAFYHTKQS